MSIPAKKRKATFGLAKQLSESIDAPLRLPAAIWLACFQLRHFASQGKTAQAETLIEQATAAMNEAIAEGVREIGERN